jgi:SPP1 gp7 family putative phage head morphogenesis protein
MPEPLSIGFNVPFHEAIAQTNSRGVVLPSIYYGQLQGVARQKAFSIAGIMSLDQLQAVKDSLDKAIKEGRSFNQWRKEQAVLDLGLPKHRLDNIYRTNLQTSYMAGKWEQFNNPNSTMRYLMYDAINDSRVRPAHLALDGIIRAKNDPFWATHSPPCGYRCRCSLISLSDKQARDRSVNGKGLNQKPVFIKDGIEYPANPDKGWDYDKTNRMAGIERAIADKSATLSPTLKSAYDEKMLKAWNTNIAKKIPVNDLTGLHDLLTDYAKIYPEHLPHGVKAILPASNVDDFFMATDGKGVFKIANIETVEGFKPAVHLIEGLQAINQGKLLTQNNEYGIENLWHEILHNQQIGGTEVMLLDYTDPRRKLMEAVNQYVSRMTYVGFVDRLGGKALHQEWIFENGYGYRDYVRRLRLVFETLGISKVIKGDLLNINVNFDLMQLNKHLTDAITKKVDIDRIKISQILFLVVNGFEAKFNERLDLLNPK